MTNIDKTKYGRIRIFAPVTRPLQAFLRTEAASGTVLLSMAVCALVWANIDPSSYHRAVNFPIALGSDRGVLRFTLEAAINDGLMTLFFLVVGMEIKRELAVGELNTVPKAILPAIAAAGGMVAPAAIYLAFNWHGEGEHGWGVPMATDIAFCVGVLTLLKRHVARPLLVFLTALAVFDDIGGILVIALFYGGALSLGWLFAALGATLAMVVLNRRAVTSATAYALGGAALWYALHRGGIHATIAGVVTGLMVPAGSGDAAPLDRFVRALHPYVAFVVMPLFALANSGVSLGEVGISSLASPVAFGTALALFVGKQLGVFSTTALSVRVGIAPLPGGATPMHLYGVSIVAGIGFTVALFIATLAFADTPTLLAEAKLGILAGSGASGAVGAAVLRWASATRRSPRSPRAASEPHATTAPAPEARRP